MSGQWGTFKSTLALTLSLNVMTGTPFAGQFPIVRQGGVCFFAPEGGGGLPWRLYALCKQLGINQRLPFVHRSNCPPLTDKNTGEVLVALVEDANRYFKEQFQTETVLAFIDTVIVAAGYSKTGDENDATVAQRVMAALRVLSEKTGILAIGVDHFGKVAGTGTRGSSVKETNADVILALLAERVITGQTANTRLAIRKVRDAVQGIELPFGALTIDMGVDEDGLPVTGIGLEWSGQTIPPPTDRRWTKSLRPLRQILMTLLADKGKPVKVFKDRPEVRACDLEIIRDEFYRQHVSDGTAEQKATARRQAFHRAITDAQGRGLIMVREEDGAEWIWLANPDDAKRP